MNKTVLKLNCFKPEVIMDGEKLVFSSVAAALKELGKTGASYSIMY